MPWSIETVVLLLRESTTQVPTPSLQQAVARILGSSTDFEIIGGGHERMYHRWQHNNICGYIGQFPFPCHQACPPVVDGGAQPSALDYPTFRTAWEQSQAWRYVDAQGQPDALLPIVLRLTAELIDDNCLLAWHYRGGMHLPPPQGEFVLPTAEARHALARGYWPA